MSSLFETSMETEDASEHAKLSSQRYEDDRASQEEDMEIVDDKVEEVNPDEEVEDDASMAHIQCPRDSPIHIKDIEIDLENAKPTVVQNGNEGSDYVQSQQRVNIAATNTTTDMIDGHELLKRCIVSASSMLHDTLPDRTTQRVEILLKLMDTGPDNGELQLKDFVFEHILFYLDLEYIFI